MADDESDDEWRFSVDEVGPDETDASDGDGWSLTTVGEDDDGPTVGFATGADDEGGGNVAGALAPDAAVESGTPSLENVAFVTAGAILTALVFVALLRPLDAVTAGAVAGGIAAGAALLYVFFRRF
jgi:hypothetical protein